MKNLFRIALTAAAALVLYLSFAAMSVQESPDPLPGVHDSAKARADSIYEAAVSLIKKYETLHQPRHWPLVGYGHMVLRGEKFSRTRPLSEEASDRLLRKDLAKNCAVFREYGKDSLLLGVLAYNIGMGAVKRSAVARKLAVGDRDIYQDYLRHCRYRGREVAALRKRRDEEFRLLFDPEADPLAKAAGDVRNQAARIDSAAILAVGKLI